MLGEAADLGVLIEGLKRTHYGPALENLRERESRLSSIVAALRSHLSAEARSVIRQAPGTARRVLEQLHRRHELNNLKAVLRGISAGESAAFAGDMGDRIQRLLFPVGGSSAVPVERMMEAGSIGAAIELMRGTPYYEALSLGLKRYSSEQSLFPIEVALDLGYWRKLWQEARKLSGEDQTQAVRVIGSLVDTNNLMWAIRYRIYKHISEEELINYTLPFGHRIQDSDIRAIAAGGDIASTLTRVFPELQDAGALLDEPQSGLPRLEIELKRSVVRRCLAAFLGNPFHIGIPLAYLVLHDLEVQDLIVLLEAKVSQVVSEEFHPYLVSGAGVAA
jgi:vacuolar-type H+-ATPase subunit C/Vma6